MFSQRIEFFHTYPRNDVTPKETTVVVLVFGEVLKLSLLLF